MYSIIHGQDDFSFEDDMFLQYSAHMEELEDAVDALINGESFEFSFDLTSYDQEYLAKRISSIVGSDFFLDFQ